MRVTIDTYVFRFQVATAGVMTAWHFRNKNKQSYETVIVTPT